MGRRPGGVMCCWSGLRRKVISQSSLNQREHHLKIYPEQVSVSPTGKFQRRKVTRQFKDSEAARPWMCLLPRTSSVSQRYNLCCFMAVLPAPRTGLALNKVLNKYKSREFEQREIKGKETALRSGRLKASIQWEISQRKRQTHLSVKQFDHSHPKQNN